MEIKDQIQVHLDSGFTKADLEYLIDLPINSLSGFFAGGRKYSKKNQLRILRWLDSENKPDPLTLKIEVVRKPKADKKEKTPEIETKDESQSSFKLNLKQILALPKQEQGETKSELDEQIAKLEERLLLPPKYLPKNSRDMVERKLASLNKLK